MYFRLDKDNNIIDCGNEKYADDCLFTKDTIERAFDGSLMFKSDMETKEYQDKKAENDEKLMVEMLRFEREKECFSVINRGKLWYDNLSEKQLLELDIWYKSWLDITQTKEKPQKPNFI